MRAPAPLWFGAAAIVLAACGAASTPASTGNGGGNAPSAATVKVGTAIVSGTSEQVLTDSSGYTLYYFAIDTPTTSKCTGSCVTYWPPVLLASGQPTASGTLSGTLTVVTDADGRQVEYNGHLLYRYAGDSAPGQASGNGISLNGGLWYAATPSTAAGSTGPSASASPSASGYSGGY